MGRTPEQAGAGDAERQAAVEHARFKRDITDHDGRILKTTRWVDDGPTSRVTVTR